MPLPTLLIWDFNGTILDDGLLLVETNNKLNRDRGIPEISYAYYRDYFDHPPRPFYEGMGYDFSKENYDEVSREFLDLYEEKQQSAPLMPHVLDCLRWAAERHIPQIILSAHQQSLLEAQLQRLGIAHYFAHVSGESSHVIGGKIDRARALAQSGAFDFSKAFLIGDTTHDYDSAKAMGCSCVLYSGGHQSLSRLQQADAPVIASLEELPALLEQLCNTNSERN